jgi:hypothetical protein
MTDTTPIGNPLESLKSAAKKEGLSSLATKEMIEEQIGGKIICKCEIFSDPRQVKRKKRLSATFDVDFGEPGRRNLDVV